MKCRMCGNEIAQTVGKRGRPPVYCSDECRNEVRRRYQRSEYQALDSASKKAHGISGVRCSICGRPLWRSSKSPPQTGVSKCVECRRKAREHLCPECGVLVKKRELYCSQDCYRQAKRIGVADLAEQYRAKCRRRRALKRGLPVEKYTLDEIASRDKYRCALCGKLVNMELSGMADFGPTVDHRIPLIKGGSDTRDNVQLAHRICNLRKGDRVI